VTRSLIAAALAIAALFAPTAASAATHYIDGDDPVCSDEAEGTSAQPWCTLAKGATAPAGSHIVVRDAATSYGPFGELSVPNVRWEGVGKPQVGSADLRAGGIRMSGFHVTGSPFAQWDARGAPGTLFENNEFDHAITRFRNADNSVVRSNYFHDGPTYSEAIAGGAFGGCAAWFGAYMQDSSRAPTFENNLVERWFGDGVHLNSIVGARIIGNRFLDGRAEGGDHVDLIQVLGGRDHLIERNLARDWQHGILVTDFTPEDGPDADVRAMIVRNNAVHTRIGYGWNGPPGPNSLVINNSFGTSAETLRGVSVTDTVKSDPQGSDGAVFANNAVEGDLGIAGNIAEHHNLARDPFGYLDEFALPAGHRAVNAADPGLALGTDIFGQPRIGPPDIGAQESPSSDSGSYVARIRGLVRGAIG
jgi:hypothetical protein